MYHIIHTYDHWKLWTVDAADIGGQRPEWQFGQVEVATNSDYRIAIVGEASNGGFAIDDIRTYAGPCERKEQIVCYTNSLKIK